MTLPTSFKPVNRANKNEGNLPSSFKKKSKDEKPQQQKEPEEESVIKSYLRTALQPVVGYLQATAPGVAANFWSIMASGEAFDEEEIDRLEEISKQEGVPFDREKYMQAANTALQYLPTISNISKGIEEKTGVPLEAKTDLQKAIQIGTSAAKFQPGAASQKAVAGAVTPTVSHGLKEAGVPEPLAELGGFATGGLAGAKTPGINVSLTKTKPSGLPERQFENVKKPREVTENKLKQLNSSLESDFKAASSKIIKESPIGETAESLKNDPKFKLESRELLNEAQEVANSLPDRVPTKILKKEIADIAKEKVKGFSLSEYDKNYLKFSKENINDIIPQNASLGEFVEQYRKNNKSLAEYFEPGSSKALNRAKRDAILDHNRAIANVIKKTNPDLSSIFNEGNDRWSKIMNVEAIDDFVSEVFSGKKVDYRKLHDFFDKGGYDRMFKKALGEEGYKNFEQLIGDMLTSEVPYKMLEVAKEKGFTDFVKTMGVYAVNPKLGHLKAGADAIKYAYKGLLNAILDKPKISINFRKAVSELKKGNFSAAEKEMNKVTQEIEPELNQKFQKNMQK